MTPILPSTDVSGVVSVLGAFPRLAESGPAFLPLLKSLRFAEQTQSWKIAVRYLIHRSPTLPPDVEVLIGDRQQGVWGKLAAAALAISGHPERVVPASDLTRSLEPVADALGFAQLDANSVAALVREAGVERIEISFTPEERMAVLRGWQDHADLIRGLPLHDAANGSGMKRINQKSYWAEAGEIGTLSGTVTLLQLCQDERLAAIQRNVHQQILKPVEVVRLIALFDTGTSLLSASANPDDVWRSFWAVLSKSRERHDLHDRFIWGEFGAATRFYAERAALPTGLDALDYRNLTSLGVADTALHGILDRHPAVFALVAKWDAFHWGVRHRAGSVVSYKRVGKHLPKQLARIDLAALLAAELQDSFVNPELAGQLRPGLDARQVDPMEGNRRRRRSSCLSARLWRRHGFRIPRGKWCGAGPLGDKRCRGRRSDAGSVRPGQSLAFRKLWQQRRAVFSYLPWAYASRCRPSCRMGMWSGGEQETAKSRPPVSWARGIGITS